MERHICQRCGHLWGEHGSKSCLAFGCCCGRSRLDADKHNNQDVNARIAALEAELAAEREAKEALAKTCVTLWTSGDFIRKADAWSEMMSNPIARAEVEKAGKAREA